MMTVVKTLTVENHRSCPVGRKRRMRNLFRGTRRRRKPRFIPISLADQRQVGPWVGLNVPGITERGNHGSVAQ